MLYIIDNGHGAETPGKRSPDGALQEWLYNRQIARAVVNGLRQHDIPAVLLVPEIQDIPLRERVRRANELYDLDDSAVLVSIHVNAAGMGDKWCVAQGWSAFVAKNAGKESRQLATCLASEARSAFGAIRQPTPDVPFWTQNLAICRDTKCPAVLTENLFMDNEADCRYLLSDEGRNTIAQIHINALRAF